MHIYRNQTDSPIIRGIKRVGIGKRGSQNLDSSLAKEILDHVKNGKSDPVATAAFFGALTLKGISTDEKILEKAFKPGILNDPILLSQELTKNTPEFIKWICI